MSSVNLIAFGTFGNPNGFTQTFFAGSPLLVKTFDIRGSILIYPDSKLYAVRKEYKDGAYMVAYTIYTYAKEPTSAREGSFIGSSMLFIDQIADENITIRCLNEFHENLLSKNVENGTLNVKHSDQFSISRLTDFDKIGFNLKKIQAFDSVQPTNKQLMVYCETNPGALQKVFRKALDLLNVYDTIYFTDSAEIAEFVHQKNIFQLVQKDGFENEIRKLAEERKRKIRETISDFEKEKVILENSRKQAYEDFRSRIEKNKEKHIANSKKIADSERDLNGINEIYQTFFTKLDELLNRLKTADNSALEDIRGLYKANKNIFNESLNKLDIKELEKLGQAKKANSQEPFRSLSTLDYFHSSEGKKNKERSNSFKIATVILSILLVAAISGLVWFYLEMEKKNTQENNKTEVYDPIQQEVPLNTPAEDTVSLLRPQPNADADLQIKTDINVKLKKELKIDSVTRFVFKANPKSVQDYYKHQKNDYSKLLFEKNKQSFEISENQDTLYVSDLQYIPIYK